MFDSLSKGLSGIIKRLLTGTSVDKRAVEEILAELERILLEADVSTQLVEELKNRIRKKCLEEKVPPGLTLREHVLKTIYEELVSLLGGKPSELIGKKRIMLVGLFGSGKCVHPESLIPLTDGRILTASELYSQFSSESNKISFENCEIVDISSKDIFVPSFNPNSLKIENKRITHLWKLKGKELLQVHLDNGNDFSVKVTPEHPFFVLRNGEVKQIRADELRLDDFVAVPRTYKTEHSRYFYDILPELRKMDLDVKGCKIKLPRNKTIKKIWEELPFKRNYCRLTVKMKNKVIPISLVSRTDSPYLLIKYKKSQKFIRFPRYLTPELAEFLGYVFGDGELAKNYVEITTGDEEIIGRVKFLSKFLFNLESKVKKDLRTQTTYHLVISSQTLSMVMNKVFGIPIGQKGKHLSIPAQLLQSNLEVITKFIRAYFDCDASATKNKREIEFTSESNTIIKQIHLLLLRFGIVSTISKKIINNVPYWRLHIRSRYAEVYAQKIGFGIKRKNEIIANYTNIGILQGCGKQDIIPLGKVLAETRMSLGFSMGEIQNYINSYGNYEKKGFISRESLFKLCKVYKTKRIGLILKLLLCMKNGKNLYQEFPREVINGSIQQLINYGIISKNGKTILITSKGLNLLNANDQLQKLNYLETLATSDVCWLRVNKIEKCKEIPEFVYDFTVEENHSFIADGIIVHNTTSAGKIARYFQKQGLKPALVCLDYHRPAAPEQLKQLAEKIRVPCYIDENKDPYSAAEKALERLKKYDTIIFDTAGRNALDKELADELKRLGEIIKPDEVLLTIPADLGKVAKVQSEEFNKLVGITGIFITKMDGTAKGGGALSACAATGAKVKFIGTGEKLEQIEVYNPERFVSRLLGLGDLQTLLEKAKEAEIKPEKVEKMIEGKFTLQDFYEQIEAISKMGSLSSLARLIPGMSMSIPEDLLKLQESKLKRFKVIIQSMTPKEREDPTIINSSRIRRIAKGAGVPESEVRELLKQYEQIKKITKMFSGKGQKGMIDMLKRFGKFSL